MSADADIADLDAQALLADAAREAHAAMRESRERMKAAESAEDYERYDRAFHRECRNLRQNLALRDKLKRDAETEARVARETRSKVDQERADEVRDLAIERATRLVWTESERKDWNSAIASDIEAFIEKLPDAEILAVSLDQLVDRALVEMGVRRSHGTFTENPEYRRPWGEDPSEPDRPPPDSSDPDTS